MKFPIKGFFSKYDQTRATFIEEIFDGNLHFLFSDSLHDFSRNNMHKAYTITIYGTL